MVSSDLVRWGGLAAIVAGVAWAGPALDVRERYRITVWLERDFQLHLAMRSNHRTER